MSEMLLAENFFTRTMLFRKKISLGPLDRLIYGVEEDRRGPFLRYSLRGLFRFREPNSKLHRLPVRSLDRAISGREDERH